MLARYKFFFDRVQINLRNAGAADSLTEFRFENVAFSNISTGKYQLNLNVWESKVIDYSGFNIRLIIVNLNNYIITDVSFRFHG